MDGQIAWITDSFLNDVADILTELNDEDDNDENDTVIDQYEFGSDVESIYDDDDVYN